MTGEKIDEKAIFNVARGIEAAEARAEYLRQACREDARLIERVEALLRGFEEQASFLETPAPGLDGGLTTAQPIAEHPGSVIGPYKLLQQIGEGGMGVVFMAEQTEPIQRTVALKIIKPGMDTRQVIARFEAERQALAMMDHPNIAKVLDAGTTGGGAGGLGLGAREQTSSPQSPAPRPFFVMELVKGVPITKYCDDKQLSIRQRLELFKPVCEAVQHAHQKGIIHRDIKPTNVLVAEYDNHAVPKVIDFGVAKATAQKLTERTMFTEFGQVIGTFEYMSPEQAKFNQLDIDTRSDIYSLGVLLYELLTGSTPFERERLREAAFDEVLRIIREEEPPAASTRLSTIDTLASIATNRHTEPARLGKDIRGELDWIVMRSLEKDRACRYQSAAALSEDIRHYLTNQPVDARPTTRTYRIRKFIRRNKAGVLAGSAIVAALIAGLVVSSVGLLHARKQAKIARTEAARSEQVARFLKVMLESAGPAVARGRDATLLREILDDTAERVGNDLKDQPLVEAELRHTIGEVYHALGDFAKAEPMYRAALELRKKAVGPESAEVAASMSEWGYSLWEAGQETEAEQVGREALAMQRKFSAYDNQALANSLSHLGFQLSMRGRLSEGEDLLREAIALQRKASGDDDPKLGSLLSHLGANLWRQGKLNEAESCCREAISRQRKSFGNSHPALADSLSHLASVLKVMGRLQESESVRRESLEIRRKVYPAYHFHVIHAFDFLGDVLLEQGKKSEAETNYHEMFEILRKAVESMPDKPETANMLAWRLVTCPLVELRDPPRAVELAQRAVALAPKGGNYWNTIGAAQYRNKDWREAIKSLEKSMELRGGGDPEDWFVLAMVYWQLDDKATAREWYVKAAEWTDKNQRHIDSVSRFRAEAAELLGISKTLNPKP